MGTEEDPWHVRHRGDVVDVHEIEQVESAEREDHRAQPGGFDRQFEPSKQTLRADEHREVRADDLQVERRTQRKQSIDQQMQGMRHARFAFAV